MDNFAPILLILFWVVIGIPLSIARKAANQKTPVRRAAPKAPAEEKAPAEPVQAPAERLTAMTPTISVTDHDDSVYMGSLNAVTGEGYDPCHEEQMSTLTLAEQAETPKPLPAPHAGLPLGWTNNDVVRGIVMSEILNRKH